MNISNLKTLIANLPDEITPEQFAMIELDYEDLLAAQRQADEEELAATLARVAKLQEKLGQVAPLRPSQAMPTTMHAERDLTDYNTGVGSDDEGGDASSVAAEMAELKARTAAKRRRLHS